MELIVTFLLLILHIKYSFGNDCLANEHSVECQICPSKEIVKLEELNDDDDILKGDKMFIIENSGR